MATLGAKEFSFGGKREKIDGKAAAKLLSPLAEAIDSKNTNRYESLRFGGKSFNLAAANELAKILPGLKGVQRLDLSDILAGQETEEARKVLKVISKAAQGMDVSEIYLDQNALGENGIKACKEILTGCKNIRELSFNDCGLESEAGKLLSTYILSSGKPTKLEKFHIFNNCFTSEGAKAIAPLFASSPNLKDIRVSTTRISRDGGLALCQSLVDCKNLENVDFSDNSFGEEAGKVLVKVFSNQQKLKNLNISDCGVGEAQYLGILKNLCDLKVNLETLGMSHSDITKESANVLASFISQCTNLKSLNLEGNELESEGAIIVLKALLDSKNPIEEINFLNNQIKSGAVEYIIKLIREKETLKSLNLDANMISLKSVQAIRKTLKELNKNALLDSMEDNDEDEDEENIEELMKNLSL